VGEDHGIAPFLEFEDLLDQGLWRLVGMLGFNSRIYGDFQASV